MSVAIAGDRYDLFVANTDGEVYASGDEGASWQRIATRSRAGFEVRAREVPDLSAVSSASRQPRRSRTRFRELNPSRFNFVTLALIASVVRAGSISAGAKAMNLALAAASKRIADFESYVGVAIFSRLPQGVELTDAGRAIFHNILSILENVEQLHRNIEEIGAGGRSHVRIWVSPAAISERIPEELSSFLQTHKDITVELEERDSSEIIKAVRENRADIGIFVDAMNSNGLQTRVYCEEELVVIVPDGPSAREVERHDAGRGAELRFRRPAVRHAARRARRLREQPARQDAELQDPGSRRRDDVQDGRGGTRDRHRSGGRREALPERNGPSQRGHQRGVGEAAAVPGIPGRGDAAPCGAAAGALLAGPATRAVLDERPVSQRAKRAPRIAATAPRARW